MLMVVWVELLVVVYLMMGLRGFCIGSYYVLFYFFCCFVLWCGVDCLCGGCGYGVVVCVVC